MSRTWRSLMLLLGLLLLSLAPASQAAEMDKYFRIAPAGEKWSKVETSVVRFRSPEDPGLEVDLVGVIHLAEKPYYEKINQILDGYDVVIYEFNGRKGEKPQGRKWVPPGYPESLHLVDQGDVIRYDRKHFVHADMDNEEIEDSLRRRGVRDDRLSYSPWGKVLDGLFGAHYMRWKVARGCIKDPERSPRYPVIIEERNGVALNALGEQLAKGHKRIAIFYGAAHMPDFEQHLTGGFGMVAVVSEWLTAWEMIGRK